MPIEVRPIKPSDRDLLEDFHGRQSQQSIYLRFFQFRPNLSSAELDRLTQVDYVNRMAFVALIGGELVAVARYEELRSSDRPEIAFFVDDQHHGRGLGTLMLEYLAAAARSHGIEGFSASVLPENHAMLGVFKRAGFTVKTWFEDGLIGVDLDIAVTAEMSDAVARRLRRARSRSVARLLRPSSVAIVGASRHPGTVGHELLRELIDGGFTGAIHPVNPAADEVLGYRSHPSLSDIGDVIDLVVIAVPAEMVEAVVVEAATCDAAGLLVVSTGFSDSSEAGADLERRIVDIARSNGMRLVGPSSFGLINTAADVGLRAVMLPVRPTEGGVGVIAQSGPLGAGVLEYLRATGVGVSSFLGAGNRADVSVNDVLDYWLVDDATRIAVLYVENFGNLRNFASTARAVTATKPIVTLRPPDDDLVELMTQAGVVLTGSVAEMVAVARIADSQPVPAGTRVAVVSNTASVARLAVAACHRAGLDVVVPDGLDRVASYRSRGVEAVIVGDLDRAPGSGRRLDYEEPLVAAAVSAEVDAVLVAVVPYLDFSIERLGRLLGRVSRSVSKPMVATGLVGADQLSVPGLPLYGFPDEAAQALGRLARYGRWRLDHPPTAPLATDDDIEQAAETVRPLIVRSLEQAGDDRSSASGQQMSALIGGDTTELIDAIGLPVADWRVVERRDDLQSAAEAIGYPVVIKAGRSAKRTVGELGGVAIDIHDEIDLLSAFDRMAATRPDEALPVVVQAMVASNANAKIELVQDPSSVAFVRVGVGGAVGSSLEPLARRFLPMMVGDETYLVDALAGSTPLDDASKTVIVEILRRLAAVAAAVPELARAELDPVLVAGSATSVGEITIDVRAVAHDPLAGVRRL
ncbi:MAG: GNAT family N-acetyltransferase [Acidimicrobiales bacterium]